MILMAILLNSNVVGSGEGVCFTTAKPEGNAGREKIRQRLRNSLMVANAARPPRQVIISADEDVVDIEREKYLPTLWGALRLVSRCAYHYKTGEWRRVNLPSNIQIIVRAWSFYIKMRGSDHPS